MRVAGIHRKRGNARQLDDQNRQRLERVDLFWRSRRAPAERFELQVTPIAPWRFVAVVSALQIALPGRPNRN